MKLVTAAEMRSIEEFAVRNGASFESLMQRAGEAVAEEVRRSLDEGDRALILVGPGNNGGDGLVCAQTLAEHGYPVTVYVYRRTMSTGAGFDIVSAESDADSRGLTDLIRVSAIIVDALLGIGQSRPPDADLRRVLRIANTERSAHCRAIAVDVPTGVDADSGRVWSECFQADTTLAMGFPKRAAYLHPGASFFGDVKVVDLGFHHTASRAVSVQVTDVSEVRQKLPGRRIDANKGSGGRLLAISGSRAYIGAPSLVAVAAYRVGAGLVQLAVPDSILMAVASHGMESIYLPLPDTGGRLNTAALQQLREAAIKARAVVCGPGIGDGDEVVKLVDALIHDDALEGKPLVVDADGLNALAQLDRWWESKASIVVTPHPGEMARLTGLSVQEVQTNRIDLAQAYATRWKHTVVLKGAGTVIATPPGETWVNPTGGQNLATAGTGDVLTGTIGGLLAQGATMRDAAVAGVYLHGLAGDLARAEMGDTGTIASDLHGYIPSARQSIVGAIQKP